MDKITVPILRDRKGKEGNVPCEKISALTAYDYPSAKWVDAAGIDIVLVGDSLGMVVAGEENTLSVTMDQMIYHTKMVSRAVTRALVVGDMPFLSYQISRKETIANAGRFLKEAGAAAVKLEGGASVANRIEALVKYDIPVMAHIGLTPQSVHRMGGYKVQRGAEKLLSDAKSVESSGAFALVLEGVPIALAKEITESVQIPTIGIGAGPYCDGQILVLHDLLGLCAGGPHPKFIRGYADIASLAHNAITRYRKDVASGKFPSLEEGYV